ncbi:MAG: hypothetical protein ABIW79_10615 [Gemmatimonas sp.]
MKRALLLAVGWLAIGAGHPQAQARGQTARATSQAAARTDSVPGVKSGFLVRPDTVMVGDPFVLVVSVVVPNSARVEWPSINDTAAVVAMRAPVRVQSAPDGVSRRETAEYELAAWDVGALAIGMPDPVVRNGSTVIKVPLADARVFVQTVLPADTSLHVPKPAKALFPRVVPWWQRWWPALAVMLALALLWWFIKRRRKVVDVQRALPVDIFARAIHDFDRLDRLALADAGERGRAVALAVEILRVYVVSRIPDGALSLTSGELLSATSEDDRLPHDRLARLLLEADAIKFARRVVQGARAKELTAEARRVVESVEAAHQARIAAEAERREEAERLERESRVTADDDARRRSRRKAGAA